MTVPERPQSTYADPACVPGVITQVSPEVSTSLPSARSASAISSESRLRSALRIREVPSANAERTSSRAISDFEPAT